MNHDHQNEQEADVLRKAADRSETTGTQSELGTHVGNRAFAQAVQRSTEKSQGAGALDPEIASNISNAKSGGEPLDDATKVDMESHLGADLSGVRVHADSQADQLSRSVQAEAFTTGSDVFFKSGKYTPDSGDGRRLLAHELTHVVQQSSGGAGGEGQVSHPDDPHEQEARAVGDAVASSPRSTVDRQEVDEEQGEESIQLSVDRSSGEEEEEEIQLSVDRDAAEDEEEVQLSVERQDLEEMEEDSQA